LNHHKTCIVVFVSALACTSQGIAQEEKKVEKLPPIVVKGGRITEEQPIAESGQPKWTMDGRVGPTTAAYVMPPWSFEFAHWWLPTTPREGGTEHAFQEEIEFGWPYRFQTDFYLAHDIDSEHVWRYQATQIEVRWAFADWGKLPLNPTLYAEWKFARAAADSLELKLLLAETIAPRWHWGLNLAWEQQFGDERTTEYTISQAFAYTVKDSRLWLGVEMMFASESEIGERSHPTMEFLIGPSLQWRPTPHTQLSLVPLFGVTDDAPAVQGFVTFRISFGSEKEGEALQPASLRSR
jgi:hypothetical protein